MILALMVKIAIASNEFTYDSSPEAGKPFAITWNPSVYDEVLILLNKLTDYPYYVPTTSTIITSKGYLI